MEEQDAIVSNSPNLSANQSASTLLHYLLNVLIALQGVAILINAPIFLKLIYAGFVSPLAGVFTLLANLLLWLTAVLMIVKHKHTPIIALLAATGLFLSVHAWGWNAFWGWLIIYGALLATAASWLSTPLVQRARNLRIILCAVVGLQLLQTMHLASGYLELINTGSIRGPALPLLVLGDLLLYVAAICMLMQCKSARSLFLSAAILLALASQFWGWKYGFEQVPLIGAALGSLGWWMEQRTAPE